MSRISMKEGLVGIDSCGTNMRVGVFSKNGKRLYMTSRKNTPIVVGDQYYFNWKYQSRMVFEMLQEVVHHGYKILSIGISSCGESVYPIDKDGNIGNAIAWYSLVTVEQQKEFEKKASEMDVYSICFLKSAYNYSAHKINWYKRHKPSVFRRAKCWLSVDGFINYLLTGTKYFDYNQAGTTLLFDTRKRTWSEKLFELNGIPMETFPELIESGKLTGYLTKEKKSLLGIDYDVPVSLAGHDGWCGFFALGIGVSEKAKDILLTTTGTAGGLKRYDILERKEFEDLLDSKGAKYFYDTYGFIGVIPYVYPGRYYCLYGGTILERYGALVDFVMRLLYNKTADEITDADYKDMQRNIDSSRPGANGVRIYVSQNDYMRKRDLEGINVMNLSPQSTKGDIFRAVMEYLSLTDSQILGEAQRKQKMYVMGGLAKNKSYVKIRANIMNMPQFIPDEQEMNSLGAALLGGVGAGLYSSYEEAADQVALHLEKVPVNPRLVAEYKRLYGINQN